MAWAGCAQSLPQHLPGPARNPYLLREEDLPLLDSVRYTPVIFQRFVPADLDLRVTVIEDEIFAAAITLREANTRPTTGRAWAARKSGTVRITAFPTVAENLLELMRGFGLNYGAVDFRVTPDGDHVFLEVNPVGEYLFIPASGPGSRFPPRLRHRSSATSLGTPPDGAGRPLRLAGRRPKR